MTVRIERVSGAAALDWVPALSRLRIEVFREYPYLYEGDAQEEAEYLEAYSRAQGSVLVLARDGDEVVGASTGAPLADSDEAFRRPFREAGLDVGEWFYFGESVLRQSYRGQGIGHRFFDEREAHARALDFAKLAFCAVVRPDGHALRPSGYRPHDVFWKKRGFTKQPQLVAQLRWRQIDSGPKEVVNDLVFWVNSPLG